MKPEEEHEIEAAIRIAKRCIEDIAERYERLSYYAKPMKRELQDNEYEHDREVIRHQIRRGLWFLRSGDPELFIELLEKRLASARKARREHDRKEKLY